MNVPQSAKMELQAIEEKFKEFENCWTETNQKVVEIECLINWYKSFKAAYHGLFVELQRRVHIEATVTQKVAEYRKTLNDKFEKEIQERNKFNSRAIKYLPPAFHGLLSMSPLKYEIFPTENVSMLAGLKEDDELFAGIESERETACSSTLNSAPSPSSKEYIKKRTTTL
eukprot:TRINITY_DN15367_c0_g1_i8.p2 TRINITY_DN15367_c0_g1~~TRINITY_DN15367_c0_g1_i8.p2  ORF type:complete len:170 (+),score=51.15 TRINITY_DN15367_c0_g1_i8:1079-1588(+)